MKDKIVKTEEEWKRQLTPAQFNVCRLKGTEPPFSGEFAEAFEEGVYLCTCCGNELFSSQEKYNSGSGWPSYWAPLTKDSVRTAEDYAHGMNRIEIMCGACDAHLGHVFEDGPPPTGLRFCINSLSLRFEKRPLPPVFVKFHEIRHLVPGYVFNEYGQLSGNYVRADEIVCVSEHGRLQIWLNQAAYDSKDPEKLIVDYDEAVLRGFPKKK